MLLQVSDGIWDKNFSMPQTNMILLLDLHTLQHGVVAMGRGPAVVLDESP